MRYVDSTGAPLSQNKEELRQDRRSNVRDDIKEFNKFFIPSAGAMGAGVATGLTLGGLVAAGTGAAGLGTGAVVRAAKAIRRAKNRKIFEKGYTETDIDAFEL
tara:strand:+ start:292 stop:600 length:309 start_codon:yes stop_codon:yes gene_type:complete